MGINRTFFLLLIKVSEKSLKDEKLMNKVYQTIPLRKIATTQDCANSIFYLANDEFAGHIK
jgi:hypothetical protein